MSDAPDGGELLKLGLASLKLGGSEAESRARGEAERRRRAESSGLLAHARLLAVRPRSGEAAGRRDVRVRGGARRREGAASWARIRRTAGGGEAPLLLLPRGRRA